MITGTCRMFAFVMALVGVIVGWWSIWPLILVILATVTVKENGRVI